MWRNVGRRDRVSSPANPRASLGNVGLQGAAVAPRFNGGVVLGPPVKGFFERPALKVLTYHPKRMHTICAPLLSYDLSAFVGLWRTYFAFCLYAVLVTVCILGADGFDPDRMIVPMDMGAMGSGMTGMGSMGDTSGMGGMGGSMSGTGGNISGMGGNMSGMGGMSGNMAGMGGNMSGVGGNSSGMSGNTSGMGDMDGTMGSGTGGGMGDAMLSMPSAARRWAERLEPIFHSASSDFRSLISYVLGGFVVRAFVMWYTRRKNYAALCGSTRNLILHAAASVPDEPSLRELRATGRTSLRWEEVAEARRNLARWVILAHELAMLKARGAMDAAVTREWLKAQGLCEAGEWQAMVNGDRHTTVIFWIEQTANRLLLHGALTSEHVAILAGATTFMRGQANDLQSALDRDIPYPYAALVGMLVKINLMLMSTWKGFEMALDFCGEGPPARKWHDAWTINRMSPGAAPACLMDGEVLPSVWASRLLVLFFWNLSYAAMYDLHKILHNPFGNRKLDVAHEVIQKGLHTLAQSLLVEVAAVLPPGMLRGDGESSGSEPQREPQPLLAEVPRKNSAGTRPSSRV